MVDGGLRAGVKTIGFVQDPLGPGDKDLQFLVTIGLAGCFWLGEYGVMTFPVCKIHVDVFF